MGYFQGVANYGFLLFFHANYPYFTGYFLSFTPEMPGLI